MFKNDINLNLYKTFYDVARFGSFSKAAELTYTTQPAISKAIKKLESELETELFYRKPNGVELTSKGRELLFYVEKSFGNLLTAERILLETETLNRGKLSIGVPSNICLFYLNEKIEKFHESYPNIEITITTGSTTQLLELLDIHKVDFVIDVAPVIIEKTSLTLIDLEEVNYCFVKKNNSKYQNINNLKDLENVPLILPIPGTYNRECIDELFKINGVEINNQLNIHTSELMLSFVDKDLGIAYILEDLVKDKKDYNILNITNLPKSNICLVYNKKFLPNAPKKFLTEFLNIDMN